MQAGTGAVAKSYILTDKQRDNETRSETSKLDPSDKLSQTR